MEDYQMKIKTTISFWYYLLRYCDSFWEIWICNITNDKYVDTVAQNKIAIQR